MKSKRDRLSIVPLRNYLTLQFYRESGKAADL